MDNMMVLPVVYAQKCRQLFRFFLCARLMLKFKGHHYIFHDI